MFIEIHILQNFAPSNLNRDDTGAPKDCEFGGYRRARISSQSLKRAVRRQFMDGRLLDPEQVATRTKRLVEEDLVPRLCEHGHEPDEAAAVAIAALKAVGLDFDKKNTTWTEYLLFLSQAEIDRILDFCLENWEGLKDGKAGDVPKPKIWDAQHDGGKAADLALFGRMLADLPERNVDAASQVAHAISTHQVSFEFDFFTAVDDLLPDSTAGAGMMGTVEFNSACFYRYANVDTSQLVKNLGNDTALAQATVAAYLRALKDAIPTGKQNSMAAQNPPSFVLVVVRDRGLWSLANAFVNPVRVNVRDPHDLVTASQAKLSTYWSRLNDMYGNDGIRGVAWVAIDDRGLNDLAEHDAGTFEQLVARTLSAAFPEGAEVEVA